MNNDYPTDEQLQAILDFKGSPRQFIEYINSIWWSEGFTIKPGRDDFKKGVKRCYLSTWGWSGNEDIIAVLRQTWFWMLWWRQSNRGGHYEFEVPNDSFLKSLTSVSGLEGFGMPHSKIDQTETTEYLLVLQSFNVRTTVKVELTSDEHKLIKDINASLVKQKAENILDVERIV